MEPSAKSRNGWFVKWGDTREYKKLALPPRKQGYGRNFEALFEGVDERGKVVHDEEADRGVCRLEPKTEGRRALA